MTETQLAHWRAILRFLNNRNALVKLNRDRKAIAVSMLLANHYSRSA